MGKQAGFWRFVIRGLPIAIAVGALAGATSLLLKRGAGQSVRSTLRVLSYSAFVNSWGPGPEIAKRFAAETGMTVEFHDAGDAVLLLKKLELFPADVVIGFDQATLVEAKTARIWKSLSGLRPPEARWPEARWPEDGFLAIDWAPMAFIFRQAEIEPPRSLSDLADARFRGAIALQDPRTSTPGLQFFLWVLAEMGVDKGFEFLASLKPNLHSVSASWSTSYGIFSKSQAKLAFSYLTSPVYHWTQEKDLSYQAAVFESGHPVQIEYLAVPDTCVNCAGAESFARFMLKPETQKLIMEKNFMLPVIDAVREGEFAKLPSVKTLDPARVAELMRMKDELFVRWQSLGL